MSKTLFEVAMASKDITGAEIARKLGVSDTVVSHWKHGRLYVAEKYRSQLAEILEVRIDELVDGRGVPKLAEQSSLTN